MFDVISQFVHRQWKLILIAWVALTVLAVFADKGMIPGVPVFKDVAEDGEFAYLPPGMQSLEAESLLIQGFQTRTDGTDAEPLRSSVVVVIRRVSSKLVEKDFDFIRNILVPELEKIRTNEKLFSARSGKRNEDKTSLIADIRSFSDSGVGKLLISEDGKASLVVLDLKSEFMEWRNKPLLDAIEELVHIERGTLKKKKLIPPGLDLKLSGTATVGRDMLIAGQESASSTELWTVALVVLLLLMVYRGAIIVALIPLVTVFASRQIAIVVITLMTQIPFPGGHYRVFLGLQTYITVIVYGAGVDYCMFLIARYKEELDAGVEMRTAVAHSLKRVGHAITASAATVIFGIGMMYFAQFGKFREAGLTIALSLIIALLAALTFTPALLSLAGRLAFWPHGLSEFIPGFTKNAGTSLIGRLIPHDRVHQFWEKLGYWLVARPGTILLTCTLSMVPFGIVGLLFHSHLSYGLLTELPRDKQSVVGAEAVQQHFPPGYAAPVTVLLKNSNFDFRDDTSDGRTAVREAIDKLMQKKDQLGVSEIRNINQPLGQLHDLKLSGLAERVAARNRAKEYFVTQNERLNGSVIRLEIIFNSDPFSRQSIALLTTLEDAIREALPEEVRSGTAVYFVGPTASIRDLKIVTDRDQVVIDILVLAAVFAILVLLLKKVAISLYLIVTVFFSYFVTLGITITAFYWLDPAGFAGLDWKVPMFLFTILIAVGEDYNIFLMTRIDEEQHRHGAIEGIRLALLHTGGIISSCGIIMAGTFCSLVIAGRLVGMQQLGFALATGVLLDTFLVRPILVPTYLILLNNGTFGKASRLLGSFRASDPLGWTEEP